MDPVLHLVRNAVSHAIETPEERIAAGKPPDGTIRLSASTAGESVVLEISDDGRGIDVDGDRPPRARAPGMAVPTGALDCARAARHHLRAPASRRVTRPTGPAAAASAWRSSASTVQDLGGTLAVDTDAGPRHRRSGSTLPLTLAITDAIIAHVGAHTFAVPQVAVREVIEVEAAVAADAFESNELLTHRGGTLPMVRLSQLFALDTRRGPACTRSWSAPALAAVGLLVDRIAGQREIVVKTIADPLIRVDGVSGATELGDGRAGADSGCGRVEPDGAASAARHRRSVGMSESASTRRRRNPAAHTYILFTVAGTTYALESQQVLHMEMVDHVTPVPNAPAFVEGVVFSRGQVVPVINLRARFGFERIGTDAAHAAARGRSTTTRRVGPAGRRSARVHPAFPTTSIQPPNEAIGGLSGNYLDGVATLGERIVLVLNLREVVETIPTAVA